MDEKTKVDRLRGRTQHLTGVLLLNTWSNKPPFVIHWSRQVKEVAWSNCFVFFLKSILNECSVCTYREVSLPKEMHQTTTTKSSLGRKHRRYKKHPARQPLSGKKNENWKLPVVMSDITHTKDMGDDILLNGKIQSLSCQSLKTHRAATLRMA